MNVHKIRFDVVDAVSAHFAPSVVGIICRVLLDGDPVAETEAQRLGALNSLVSGLTRTSEDCILDAIADILCEKHQAAHTPEELHLKLLASELRVKASELRCVSAKAEERAAANRVRAAEAALWLHGR